MVAPIFIIVVLGVSEVSKLCDIQNQLAVAAREGARRVSMDRTGKVRESLTTNGEIVKDVKNFLKASGLQGSAANVCSLFPRGYG